MPAFGRPGLWLFFFKEFHCHHCGGHEGYASRRRNFVERYFLPPLFLKPVRCGDCYFRSWRPLSVPVLPRKDAMRFDAGKMVATARAADRKVTQKETPARPEDHQRIA